MRIIKLGNIPSDKYRAECGICSSIIEAGKSELLFANDRNELIIYSKECPVCKNGYLYFSKYEEPKFTQDRQQI